jgi:hypothetical protein
MDQSHRGHDAIVEDLHSKLAAEGEECHEVDCTEHGGHDVKYARGPVSRDRVSLFLPPYRLTTLNLINLGGQHCWHDSPTNNSFLTLFTPRKMVWRSHLPIRSPRDGLNSIVRAIYHREDNEWKRA